MLKTIESDKSNAHKNKKLFEILISKKKKYKKHIVSHVYALHISHISPQQ